MVDGLNKHRTFTQATTVCAPCTKCLFAVNSKHWAKKRLKSWVIIVIWLSAVDKYYLMQFRQKHLDAWSGEHMPFCRHLALRRNIISIWFSKLLVFELSLANKYPSAADSRATAVSPSLCTTLCTERLEADSKKKPQSLTKSSICTCHHLQPRYQLYAYIVWISTLKITSNRWSADQMITRYIFFLKYFSHCRLYNVREVACHDRRKVTYNKWYICWCKYALKATHLHISEE